MQEININELNIIYDNLFDEKNISWVKLQLLSQFDDVSLNYLCNRIYNEYLSVLNPVCQIKTSKDFYVYESSNFVGGCNTRINTLHENMFFHMFPFLKKQIVFGTGKHGYKIYGTKRYIADFLDEKNMRIIEIDGVSHNTPQCKLKDYKKELFFESRGYKVIRFTNDEVETLFKHYIVIGVYSTYLEE